MNSALQFARGSRAAADAAPTVPMVLWPRKALRRFASILGLLLAAVPGFSADFAGSIILGRPTGTSIAANLLAPTALSFYLEYGTKAGTYTAQTTPAALTANQPREVELSALQPNTRYYYRLRFQAPTATTYDASPEYSFMTQRPPGSTFIFGVQGDSHPERGSQFNAELYARTLLTAAADPLDFYLAIGDDFSVDTLDPKTVTAAQVTARYTLQRPFFGIIGKSAPVFLVNGNHEQAARYLLDGTPNNVAVWAQNARNAYYAQPAPDSFYSGNAEQVPHIGLLRNYFAWTWGDALFVTIDPYWGSPVCVDNSFGGGDKRSNMWDITHGEAQYQWLKTTLEQSRAKHKFVFAHHVMGTGRGGIEMAMQYEWGGQNGNGTPGFAANRPTWSLPIHQLMAANHVTIFFQGHDHVWVRQQLDGVTYQTLSEPGDPNYALFFDDTFHADDKYPNSGYTRVTVSPTGVKVDYVRTYLPADEGLGKTNGALAFSYTLGALVEPVALPAITQQPLGQIVTVGSAATFSVGAISTLPMTYQWKRNDVDVSGASTATLALPRVQAVDTGTYTVVVSTSAGAVTSAAATLGLGSSRLVNMSVRSTAGAGNETLIVGFVVGPGAPLPLLLRGVGPTLGSFGVNGILADPVLTLLSGGGAVLATNDDWGAAVNASQITAIANQSGAFALPASSRDAALLSSLVPGSYTAQVVGKAAATGVVLMEAYDAATSPASTARFVNLSARTQVGSGGAVLIAGFVISGNVPKQVLIRGVGPTLTGFGVGGVLADPLLSLFRQGTTTALQQNDNWSTATNAAQISPACAQVGAFALPANSRDAALLVTLAPGTYTAQVSGVGNTTGVALVEIYEVP